MLQRSLRRFCSSSSSSTTTGGGGGSIDQQERALKMALSMVGATSSSSSTSSSSASSSSSPRGSYQSQSRRPTRPFSSSRRPNQQEQRGDNNHQRNPSSSLIHRLKDCLLQQQWSTAISLFDGVSDEVRKAKWRPFHFSPILEVMRRTHKYNALPRLWTFMKENPENALDYQSLNEIFATACAARDPKIVAEIQEEISKRQSQQENNNAEQKFQLKNFAIRQHERFVASDWQSALESLDKFKSCVGTSREAANRILQKIDDPAVVRHLVENILEPECNIQPDDGSYAAWISSCGKSGSWEEAIQVFRQYQKSNINNNNNNNNNLNSSRPREGQEEEEVEETEPREIDKNSSSSSSSDLVYSHLLRALARQKELSLCEQLVVEMRDAQVPHTSHVVEAVLKCFEERSKSDNPEWRRSAWKEALSYFSAMRQLNVRGTSASYDSIIRLYERRGVFDGSGKTAEAISEAMKQDGLQPDARSQLKLISAWSNKRQGDIRRRF